MKGSFLIGLATMAAAISVACGSSASAPIGTSSVAPTQAAAEIVKGQALFQQHCVVCHRADASGGLPVGNATSADLRQRNLEPLYHNNVALLTRAILDGKDQDGADLDPVMPRWRGTLNEADAQAIIAYLKTLP